MSKKVVIVTGGFGGIGIAIVQKLLRSGYFVLSSYNSKNSNVIDNILKELEFGEMCKPFKLDISKPMEVKACIENLISDYGKIYGLVNNAGITADSTFYKMSLEQWQNVLNVNLHSLFSVTQPVFKHMCDSGEGRIVNISSVNGQKGQFGQTNYSATKAGIIGFTKSLAQEGARSGVLVNAIAPGYTATDMVMSMPEKTLEMIKNLAPRNHLVDPLEIANGVSFLLDQENKSIVGATISINNGLYMD